MNKQILITIVSAFWVFLVDGQSDVPIIKNQFKQKESPEGFKEAWKEVKQGDDLFQLGKGAYFQSKVHYKKAFEYNSMNPELNYKLGMSMLLSDEKQKAKDYLQMAFDAKPEVAPDIQFFLGRAYHLSNDFEKAIELYNAYKGTLAKKQLRKEGGSIERLIVQCSNGQRLIQAPVRAVIENMGSNINSENEDYSPAVSANDSLFVFTSRRQHSKKSKMYENDFKFYEAIYFSTKNGNEWGSARMLFDRKKVNENMAVTGMSPDGSMIFVYKGSVGNGDIYYTTKKKGKWETPKAIEGKINTSNKEGSAAISTDGNTMYFTSERPKEGAGGSDIYISQRKENGKWGKPVNAGAINTPYDESGVSVHPNGKILYFSSQGHNSMGGFDIFQCEIDASGSLSNPRNLGYPINSSDDDLFYTPSSSGKVAYISSIRENTLGGTDIYKVMLLGEDKPLELGYNEMSPAGAPGMDNNIFFEEPKKREITPVFMLSGNITDAASGSPLDARVQLISGATKKSVTNVQAGLSGSYQLDIPGEGNYIVKAMANGYMPFSEDIVFSQPERKVLDIALNKIEVGDKMELKNIYFNSGTAMLKKESYEELENVYLFLMGNPTMKIQISGYTDNIGTIEANKALSEKRAKACVHYLVKKGIEKNRLSFKGYGFLHPLSHNHTPEGRSKNRRVEFEVMEK
jgi:outer membrane protein OmpA-like peptidoglycan-associated protein/tetratricopeptide (TPR) repeat protein